MARLLTILASAARTANGTEAFGTQESGGKALRIQLNVTAENDAATGETLDVVVEDTLDGTTWNTIGTFTQATGITREVINIQTPFTGKLRARWTVGGTGSPSFTFKIDGSFIGE